MADISYLPGMPGSYKPPIGLIGCGWVAPLHLQAYRNAGLDVVALCDVRRDAAEALRAEHYPNARVYESADELLREETIEVVDVATHPDGRVELIERALDAGKHVLSQKPFVLDIDVGERLVERADRRGCYLAVNQNGRWAPHYCYMRRAIAAGLIGEPFAARMSVHWDHTWIIGTAFERVRHLILYDFAIHWFDILRCLLPRRNATCVYASTQAAPLQTIEPHLVAQCAIDFEGAQATLAFDAMVPRGSLDQTFVAGTEGSIRSQGPDLHRQDVTIVGPFGTDQPNIRGNWFPDGFQGAMVELLQAIEQRRQPLNAAADNLQSLELCFAAVASSMSGQPCRPGAVRQLPQ